MFALNPVVVGSGTNLKTVEYMAAGLAIVTTPTGARGTGMADGEHAAIMERAEWPAALADLAADRERAVALGRAARRLAEERFDWPVAMRPLTEALGRRLNCQGAKEPSGQLVRAENPAEAIGA